jgi:hypothetical protein
MFFTGERVCVHTPARLWRWNRQSVPKCRQLKLRCRGITQKKQYNIQNMAKVWNQEFCLKLHTCLAGRLQRNHHCFASYTVCIKIIHIHHHLVAMLVIQNLCCTFRLYRRAGGAKQKLGTAVNATCHRFLSPAVRHISSTLRHYECKPKFHPGVGCISVFLVCVVLCM